MSNIVIRVSGNLPGMEAAVRQACRELADDLGMSPAGSGTAAITASEEDEGVTLYDVAVDCEDREDLDRCANQCECTDAEKAAAGVVLP